MLSSDVLCLKKRKKKTYSLSSIKEKKMKKKRKKAKEEERCKSGDGTTTTTMLQVTEDTPPDMLTGAMDLTVHLPGGGAVKMAIERSTPMMDLLVQITTAHRLHLSGHTLEPLSMSGHAPRLLPYKPNTPIGTLDTQHVRVVPKTRGVASAGVANGSRASVGVANGSRASVGVAEGGVASEGGGVVPRNVPPGHQPFESTFRLKVHLPRNQLYVTRVSRDVTLDEIVGKVCDEKNLDVSKYELRHPGNLDQALDLKRSLNDYKITEIYVVSRGTNDLDRTFSTNDIMALRREEERKQMHNKTGGGVFNLIFRRGGAKSSMGSGSVSSDTRSISPAPSEGSRSVTPPQPTPTAPDQSPAPKPPQRKRRPAPPPPAPPSATNRSSEPIEERGAGPMGDRGAGLPLRQSQVVVCHSRNSSDSSGYHEASVLSDTLPRRPRSALVTVNGRGEGSGAGLGEGYSRSTTNLSKMAYHSKSTTSLVAPGRKKKAAPPPPPAVRASNPTINVEPASPAPSVVASHAPSANRTNRSQDTHAFQVAHKPQVVANRAPPVPRSRLNRPVPVPRSIAEEVSPHQVPRSVSEEVSPHQVPSSISEESPHQVPRSVSEESPAHQVSRSVPEESPHQVPRSVSEEVSPHQVPRSVSEEERAHQVPEKPARHRAGSSEGLAGSFDGDVAETINPRFEAPGPSGGPKGETDVDDAEGDSEPTDITKEDGTKGYLERPREVALPKELPKEAPVDGTQGSTEAPLDGTESSIEAPGDGPQGPTETPTDSTPTPETSKFTDPQVHLRGAADPKISSIVALQKRTSRDIFSSVTFLSRPPEIVSVVAKTQPQPHQVPEDDVVFDDDVHRDPVPEKYSRTTSVTSLGSSLGFQSGVMKKWRNVEDLDDVSTASWTLGDQSETESFSSHQLDSIDSGREVGRCFGSTDSGIAQEVVDHVTTTTTTTTSSSPPPPPLPEDLPPSPSPESRSSRSSVRGVVASPRSVRREIKTPSPSPSPEGRSSGSSVRGVVASPRSVRREIETPSPSPSPEVRSSRSSVRGVVASPRSVRQEIKTPSSPPPPPPPGVASSPPPPPGVASSPKVDPVDVVSAEPERDWLPSPPRAFRDEEEEAVPAIERPELVERLLELQEAAPPLNKLSLENLERRRSLVYNREIANSLKMADTFSGSLSRFESAYAEVQKVTAASTTTTPNLPNFRISTYDRPKQRIKVFEDDTVRSNVVEPPRSFGHQAWAPSRPVSRSRSQVALNGRHQVEEEVAVEKPQVATREGVSRSNSLYDVSGLQSLGVMRLIQTKLSTSVVSPEGPAGRPPEPVPQVPRYRYRGPPTVNMGAWSDRPRVPVSVQGDADVSSRLSVSTRSDSGSVVSSDTVQVIEIGGPASDRQRFIDRTTAVGYRRPLGTLRGAENPGDISRVPIVRSVEFKKPYRDLARDDHQEAATTTTRRTNGFVATAPVVRGFKNGTRYPWTTYSHTLPAKQKEKVDGNWTTSSPTPPPPPASYVPRESATPRTGPLPQVDQRDQLLSAIRNFGGKKGLRSVNA